MCLTFAEIGKQLNVSRQRAQQLYALNRLLQRQALGHVSYGGVAEAEDDDFIEPKEFTAPSPPEGAKQQLIAFFNQNGFSGQFQVNVGWLSEPDYDFTMNISDVVADAWENQVPAMKEFEAIVRRLGYEYDLEGEPGDRTRKFHFFKITND